MVGPALECAERLAGAALGRTVRAAEIARTGRDPGKSDAAASAAGRPVLTVAAAVARSHLGVPVACRPAPRSGPRTES